MTGRPASPSLADSNTATKSSAGCPDHTQGTTQAKLSDLVLATGLEAQARRRVSRSETWPLSSGPKTQPIVTEEEEEHEEEEDEEDKSYEACDTLATRARLKTVPLTGEATEELHNAISSASAQQNKNKTIWAQQANPLSTTAIRDFAWEEKAVTETKRAWTQSRKQGKKPSGSIKAIGGYFHALDLVR